MTRFTQNLQRYFQSAVNVLLLKGLADCRVLFEERRHTIVLEDVLYVSTSGRDFQLSQFLLQVLTDLFERRVSGLSDDCYLLIAVACQLLEMLVPPLEVVLYSNLFDNCQSQQLRLVSSKSSPLEPLASTHSHIVLEILHETAVYTVFLEEHSTSQIEVQESEKGRVLHLKIHRFEESPFCLFILLLRKGLLRVSLIPVKIGHVFIEFHRFSRDNQRSRRPELLITHKFLVDLVDVKTQGEGFSSEDELVAETGQ